MTVQPPSASEPTASNPAVEDAVKSPVNSMKRSEPPSNAEGDFKKLYKKMDATSKTRFHYSRRMKLHARLSTWVVVGISLALILTSLMQVHGIGVNISSKYFSLFQVFSSIAVLVYSLMIAKNDYSSQSEKMYSCASQIGALKMKAHPYIGKSDAGKYSEINEQYQEILRTFEATSMNDFRADYWRAQLEMSEFYQFSDPQIFWKTCKWVVRYLLDFFIYPVFLVLYVVMIWWIWVGPAAAI